ncbi:hypothetical protein JI735_12935 [Paenibacillus sonchi]|uniref:Uncharacterized protein n=1 Tax=Paenibacillus sonchi TaxID=373687 RepID=A0A974PG15_9BACL|nr:hypothetical protein [Paenibacillus sonchi]QQZ63302.1 hypothetical protein JI735_12935 [Paenibacillus sonchi]
MKAGRNDPSQFNMHRLGAMLKEYLYESSGERILEQFWGIWTAIRDHIIIPFNYRSFAQITERFDFPYEMDAVFFGTEAKMVRECLERQDPEAWDRLIRLYREMMEYLTDMYEENRLNLRRSYAEAHFYKGETGTADALFKQLTEEHPEWVWGYVGWGICIIPNLTLLQRAVRMRLCACTNRGWTRSRPIRMFWKNGSWS